MKNLNGLDGFGVGSMALVDRTDRNETSKNFPILSLEINNRCSLGCPHCIARGRQLSRSPLPEEFFAEQLSTLNSSKHPTQWVSFSSLEPTETPDCLVRLAEIAHKKAKTILMTNALKLTPELQRRLQPHIDCLDPSLDLVEGGVKSMFNGSQDSMAWQNIRYAVKNRVFEKTGIIITNTSQSYKGLGELLSRLTDEFKGDNNVIFSVWFYTGHPGDPLLLNRQQFIEAVRLSTNNDFPQIRINVPEIYGQFIPWVVKELEIDRSSLRFCSQSGIPSYLFKNGQWLVLPAEAEQPLMLRMDCDGMVYLGCSHLMGRGQVSNVSVGDATKESLEDIFQTIIDYRQNKKC